MYLKTALLEAWLAVTVILEEAIANTRRLQMQEWWKIPGGKIANQELEGITDI